MSIFSNKKVVGMIGGLIIVVFLFIVVSLLSSIFESDIRQFIGTDTIVSKVAYVLVTSVAIVIAPISTLPLIPLASHIWGWFVTGLLSIIGWVIGSQIAFLLARKFGKPLVEKVFSLEKLRSFENYFTKENLFWTVVFLRMIMPVDVLSYALGLFSKISTKSFFLATVLGVTPFAFIFAYTGGLSTGLQIITFIEVIAFIGAVYLIQEGVIHKKKIILILFFLIILIVAFENRVEFIHFAQNLEKESLGNPLKTALILIGLKTISAPLGFPGTPLTLLAGSLFGNFLGTAISIIGNTLGATLAFLVSRYLLREYVQKKFVSNNKLIKRYEDRLETKPMVTVATLRLIPLFPFNALNFLLGVTNIPLKEYIVGSFIGMIPGTFIFVYFGESIRTLSWINIVFAIVGIILLTYLGKLYEKRN